ncbi:MAG: portal protein, partial [Alphaproteobacteria bacterium]|nr:portal protein [Alphaproteobacteria bacterium]
MPINLFGFTISRNESEDKSLRSQSFVVPTPEDGATTLQGGGYFGTYVDLDATSKTESELINRYRETSMHPETSTAIDEIVTEAIAAVDDEKAIQINLDKVKLPDNIKKSITEEFNNILKKLDFNYKSHDIFRRWYIDGRLYYQKVIDVKQPRRGIVELRQIDPRKIKKVREVKKEKDPKTGVDLVKSIEEYFIYNEQGINYISAQVPVQSQNTGIKITKDSITFVSSGIVDYDKNVVLSYLHKAVKPVNQLKMMEDSLVIYRLARAPERRIFYIDV